MVDTGSAQYRAHQKADGAGAKHQNLSVEVKQAGGLSASDGVYADASGLQDHSLLNVQAVDLEISSALSSDEQVGCEPTVEGVILVLRHQTEDTLLVAQVGVTGMHTANVAFAAGDYRGNDLIADLQGLAGGVALDVLTKRNNLTGTLVAEDDGAHAEGVTLPLVHVSSAHARAFDLDQNVIVAELGNVNFLNFDFSGSGQYSDLSLAICGCARRCGCGIGAGQDLTDDALNLRSGQFHNSLSFRGFISSILIYRFNFLH